jgi:5-methyltetrahydrofolate--homocysteine methyltransferase
MATVIERLQAEGLRDKVTVLVGGAPLNSAFAEDIAADRYCKDAAEAVDVARAVMQAASQRIKKGAQGG